MHGAALIWNVWSSGGGPNPAVGHPKGATGAPRVEREPKETSGIRHLSDVCGLYGRPNTRNGPRTAERWPDWTELRAHGSLDLAYPASSGPVAAPPLSIGIIR